METGEFLIVFRWWLTWFGFGMLGWPLVSKALGVWKNKGYIFGKVVGVFGVAFFVLVFGLLKIFEYGTAGIVTGVLVLLAFHSRKFWKSVSIKNILFEEMIFLIIFVGWVFVKGHQPDINGLEKFMDYGIAKSISVSRYFPPADMWYAGEPINYYYFGHLVMSLVSKVSNVDLAIGFNLMLSTICALCFTSAFAIGRELLRKYNRFKNFLPAIFIAYLVTFSGNLHTIYKFTTGYDASLESPTPFWQIMINPFKEPEKLKEMNGYWYPNATRFIPYTIHEFPSYSFVVSDLHGHVLSIPLALLVIAIIINVFVLGKTDVKKFEFVFYSALCGVMFMTNALDGPIYLGLFLTLMLVKSFQFRSFAVSQLRKDLIINFAILVGVFFVTTLPFTSHFKPFVSGIAVNCPPTRMANSKIGPIIFETVDKCQKSPIWMLLVLWGFFLYSFASLYKKRNDGIVSNKIVAWIGFYCFMLIVFAEFFYFKDIYPQHFRSNTMFKLGYQAFMMLSILSGYLITVFMYEQKTGIRKIFYSLGLLVLVYLVCIYPSLSVKAYFGDITLKSYKTNYGLSWMQERLPDDYLGINWIEKHVSGGEVVLEANGDSYTDYNRISVFSGHPTVAGWTVHEWLWRGGYDPIAKRAEEVRQIYEPTTLESAMQIIKKYNIKYIVVGNLEMQKYTKLDISLLKPKLESVFVSNDLVIYKVSNF